MSKFSDHVVNSLKKHNELFREHFVLYTQTVLAKKSLIKLEELLKEKNRELSALGKKLNLLEAEKLAIRATLELKLNEVNNAGKNNSNR